MVIYFCSVVFYSQPFAISFAESALRSLETPLMVYSPQKINKLSEQI